MATIDLKSFRVLLVDPDRFYRAILRELLRSLRAWDIHEAPDLEAARPLLTEELDLLVADWSATQPLGQNVLKQIRAGDTGADPMLPAIVVMADTMKRNVLLARDAGANELVAKPVMMRRLFERLQYALLAPQPFVKTASYVGPDRRRFTCSEYHGPNRRRQRGPEINSDEGGSVALARRREWPTGAPFVAPTQKLIDIKMRADQPGISMAEAVGNIHRGLKDLEDHHRIRLARAIKRLKWLVTDVETVTNADTLGRELRPPALDIASTAPVFGYTLAGDIAWMLKSLVELFPLEEAPVLTMCRRLVETLRVTLDACVYDSGSAEGERILKELQATNRRLMKRYRSTESNGTAAA